MKHTYSITPHRSYILLIRFILFAVFGVLATIFFDHFSIDFVIQDVIFDFKTGKWFLPRKDQIYYPLLYTGPRHAIKVLLLAVIISLILSIYIAKIKPYRIGLVIIILSILLVPSIVSNLKKATNIPCPVELERYGGVIPYTKVFESYTDENRPSKRSRCFPAAHASGGFALFSLFFLPLYSHRKRVLLLCAALATGWTIGFYKMLIGDHLFSQTFVSMLLAWSLVNFVALTCYITPSVAASIKVKICS